MDSLLITEAMAYSVAPVICTASFSLTKVVATIKSLSMNGLTLTLKRQNHQITSRISYV